MPGLTITRQPLERIQIGDTVLTIVEVRGKRVTINIVAPMEMTIRRLDADGNDEHKPKERSK